MNILFVSAILPYPLHSGGQVRLYNLLKLLSKEHEITLYTFIRDEKEKSYLGELSFLKSVHTYHRGHVWQMQYLAKALMSRYPLLMASYDHAKMREDIQSDLASGRYHVVHIEPFYVLPSVPHDLPCPLVIGEHNIEYDVYASYGQQAAPLLRPFLSMDIRKIRTQEQNAWEQAFRVIAVSQSDAKTIASTTTSSKDAVVPNGVDTNYFRFQKKRMTNNTLRCLFVGNFLWMPNGKAVERLLTDIWPEIVGRCPEAQLEIVGKHLSYDLQRKARSMGAQYHPYIDDIRTAYASSDLLLAPLTIAGGTKFKILEAMASGCPVVTTKEGIEGIDGIDETNVFLAQSPEEFEEVVASIQTNPKHCVSVARNARKLIETSYSWNTIAKKQSDVWKSCV